MAAHLAATAGRWRSRGYAQAVTSDKREAQTNVAALFVVKSAGKKKAKAA
jgi:hypothetical protein